MGRADCLGRADSLSRADSMSRASSLSSTDSLSSQSCGYNPYRQQTSNKTTSGGSLYIHTLCKAICL